MNYRIARSSPHTEGSETLDPKPSSRMFASFTRQDKKCSVGETFHPNDSDSENSLRGSDIDAIMLAPGRVGTCTQDLNNDGYGIKDQYHKAG